MATEKGSTILNRINKFFGGITVNPRDTVIGTHLNMEEVDTFESKDYIRPTTIFGAESITSALTSVTSSGTTATATSTSNHGLTTGGSVTISGADVAAYNGTFVVNVTNNKVFTYTMLSDPADTTTGTIVATYTTLRKTTGYTLDENDNLFAISKDVTGTPLAQIWKKTTASATAPGVWTHYKTSATSSNAQSPIAWHQYSNTATLTRSTVTATAVLTVNHGLNAGDIVYISGANQSQYNGTFTVLSGGLTSTNFTYTMTSDPGASSTGTVKVAASYLYYITGTSALIRLGTTPSAVVESTIDIAGITMNLPGLGFSNDRIAMIRHNGELHILNGQFVSTVDETGVFVPQAFVLPDGWSAVSADIIGNNMAILARNINSGLNSSRVFWWDLVSTTGVMDEIKIPVGGPQIIVNYQEIPIIMCAQNGVLYIYAAPTKNPQLIKKLYNIKTETTTQAIIPNASKFIFKDTVFFGLWKTDKVALYQFGRFDTTTDYALLLGKRFGTSTYSLHIPYAGFAAGPNLYASFDNNGTSTIVKLEGNNSPTFSSNAVIETIYIDGGSMETLKEWLGFIAIAQPMATSCAITISSRVDDATSYDSSSSKALNSTNDQIHSGGTTDTYWRREWVSVVGRTLQTKIEFTSNGTASRPILNSIGILSRITGIYG